jgi:hypothetical protein
MARARGAAFKLCHKVEATYGNAPTGNYAQLPCYSFDLGAEQALQADPILSAGIGREPTDPYLEIVKVSGNARVPVDVRNFGYWLKLLFGPATVTGGSDPYTHTWHSGSAAGLPSGAFEKQFPEASSGGIYFMNTGVKANTLELSFAPSGAADATIGLIGQGETKGTTSGAGTPTLAPMTRYLKQQASITLGGTPLASVTAAKLMYTNNAEAVEPIRNDLWNDGVDEGLAGISGELTLRFNEQGLLDQAIAHSPAALVLSYTYSTDYALTFTLPRVFVSRPKVGVSGPNGIEVTYKFEAAFDSTAGYALQAALKSPIAVY